MARCTFVAKCPLAHDVQSAPRVNVTLIHNPKAGDGRIPECDELTTAIADLGWKVKAVDKSKLEERLADNPGDLVIVAGGDGTVGKVAKRLAKTGIPMAIIPTGTANNVARALGVGVEPKTALDFLPDAVVRQVDLGYVRFEESRQRFLEGFGVGLFAFVMAERATKKSKVLKKALGLLVKELETYEPRRARIKVDGRDISGEYIMACVMNARSLGPALALAPDAQLDDGELDVVLVRPEHRKSLLAHLTRAIEDGDIALPQFEAHRAKRVFIDGHGRWSHVDDCVHEQEREIEIGIDVGAVSFLVPPPTRPKGK